MGGIRKFKNRKTRRQERNQSRESKPKRVRGPYSELVRESAGFEKYYKAQNIVPESEWESFLNALRQDLPAAFRISACNEKEAAILLDIVEGSFFKGLINTDDPEEEKKKPFCLPWYPKRLGWQVPISRKDIRRSETYFKLHNFLMSETDSGNISRQEVVSMIPPLVLDVQPHHKVLDMCAAPGSKTAQLIEMMHTGDSVPSGVVIANDVDNTRCYMLVHQAKRLNSPCTLVTNHDASIMPNIYLEKEDGSSEIMRYDRILCDVPCTGDGTMRKNPDIWTKWNPANSNNLHGVQMRIVKRALELLAVGGRLVYSTCSLNPLEDEAVIHRTLVEAKGAVELQDVSQSLPGLRHSPGVSHWVLASKETEIYKTFEEVPESLHNMIRPAMFPPKAEDADKYHLDRCMRVLPHHQDTGGFFIAVLVKLSPLPWESSKSAEAGNGDVVEKESVKTNGPPQKRRRIQGYREDPFVLFKEEEPVWPIIRDFYDIKPELPLDCMLTRCASGKRKNIYFVSPIIRDILNKNQEKVKIINAGVKAFARCDNKNSEYCFRLAQEGLASIEPYLGQCRRVLVTKDDLIKLLMCTDPTHPPETDTLHPDTQERLKDFGLL
ncbi:tRNA (cytosine(34)-C(5))-methyltransferase-like isoform X2 [Macrosteles quadrilineatus]|uniref:tRNA (cytosine(34)-C(5))-methyltransferase-like isoform X1 n=1 Tax=Macrosteles quadrilineatus TaxID=74068 RepID=UPI0023E34513|nr:tRNA (cytosine(34)-C(5))-methyltransferase-like isoform X1 [Macrosteles quadrilineatus]XP_054276417.1 tRNA (cytosine(34)-C(5))-methyltransferase-like isoform X2 [Macrosteles quadrilineatus]